MAFVDNQGGNTDALVSDLLRRLQGSSNRLAANVIPFRQRQQDVESKIAAVQPPPEPDLVSVPTVAPDPQITNIFKAMGPDLMAFAAIGGALTGSPITATLNNATGFLKGLHEGDAEVTRDHLEKFKTELGAAKDHNDAAIEKYKAAFENKKFTMQQLQSELTSIANEYGDPIAMHAIETGDLQAMGNLLNARESIKARIQQHQDALDLRVDSAWGAPTAFTLKDGSVVEGQKNRITGKFRNNAGDEIPQDQVVSSQPAAQVGTPEATEGMAEMIASYQVPPLSGFALNRPAGQKLMAEVRKINPQYNAVNYRSVQDTIDQFSRGQPSQRITAINTAIQHIKTLRELGEALKDPTDIPRLRAIQQAFQLEFGVAAPSNFDAAVKIVGPEIVKSIVASGGGVGEREEAAKSFSRISSTEQLEGAEDTVTKLLAGQADSLRHQYESRTKIAPGVVPFDEFLMPATRDALSKVSEPKKTYQKGDIIDTPQGKYRVTGGDPSDPDVELVK